jgi:hypothetical protein
MRVFASADEECDVEPDRIGDDRGVRGICRVRLARHDYLHLALPARSQAQIAAASNWRA